VEIIDKVVHEHLKELAVERDVSWLVDFEMIMYGF
jgi:hypothetical protein